MLFYLIFYLSKIWWKSSLSELQLGNVLLAYVFVEFTDNT